MTGLVDKSEEKILTMGLFVCPFYRKEKHYCLKKKIGLLKKEHNHEYSKTCNPVWEEKFSTNIGSSAKQGNVFQKTNQYTDFFQGSNHSQ